MSAGIIGVYHHTHLLQKDFKQFLGIMTKQKYNGDNMTVIKMITSTYDLQTIT
jgi:hypothetical protein